MASLDDIKKVLDDIYASLPQLINSAKINPNQVLVISGLSDISTSLGLVNAGEFRSGNNKEPGSGFTGVRMVFPSVVYSNDDWNLVGVNNDVIQFGLNATDGTAWAGAGAIRMDATGLKIYNGANNIVWMNASGIFIKNNLSAALSFGTSDDTRGMISIYSNTSNTLVIWNQTKGLWGGENGVRIIVKMTDNSTPGAYFGEDDGSFAWLSGITNRFMFGLPVSTAGTTLFTLGQGIAVVAGNSTGGANYLLMASKAIGGAAFDTPPNPSSANVCNIYIRSGKIIFQYNDGGTVRYKYLDLTGTGVTWVHTTSAP